MKGLFLPEITTEDFKDGCLESIEALIGEGEIYDIDYSEPCEDAISRRAAQAKIKSICNEYRLSYEDGKRKAATGGSAYALGHAFDDIPPVTPQPKTGHWIKMPLIETGQTYSHKCSLCGRRILVTDVGLSEFPYCHCGAKMESEEV